MAEDNAQDFAAVLMQHDKGKAHSLASRKLAEAVLAVQETGKAASVTIKVKLSPVKDLGTAVKLDADVTSTIPKEPSRSVWYTDDEGALHRNDPRQLGMWDEEAAADAVVRHTEETPK